MSQPQGPARRVRLLSLVLFEIISTNTLECLFLFKSRADLKDYNFELPFIWFMKSILVEKFSESMFDVSRQINLDLRSHTALPSGAILRTDGLFHLAKGWRELSHVFDIYHPYWLNRKLFFVSRAGSSAFTSVCQIQADAGYIDRQNCLAKNDYHDGLPYFVHHSFTSVINKIRAQDVKILNQQRDIDNLLRAVRSLNVTLSSYYGMKCGGIYTAFALVALPILFCFVLFCFVLIFFVLFCFVLFCFIISASFVYLFCLSFFVAD